MRYQSAVTPNGNSSYSYVSQDAAENQARILDQNNCYNCTDCNYCTDCETQPIQIIGLQWVVTIRANNKIKIGCQDHSRKFWENASDETINKMDPGALTFWKQYKQLLLSILP